MAGSFQQLSQSALMNRSSKTVGLVWPSLLQKDCALADCAVATSSAATHWLRNKVEMRGAKLVIRAFYNE